jgi:hypothetical protein
MKKAISIAGIFLSFVAGGCAIHPVPEDVTGIRTYQIVRQIRCETRKAVIDFLKRELSRFGDGPNGDSIARRLAQEYERDPESIRNFKPSLFPGRDYAPYREFFNLIYSGAIAYSFDLTMTEENDLGTNINFLGPWKSKFTLNVTGDANRQRSNERTFTITDSFQFLLANLNAPDAHGVLYCDGQIVQANYVYPIAGKIGVDESVKTFFELTVLANLSAAKAKPGQVDTPAMTDDLKFTTTVDLSGTPKVVFSPVGSGFQLADASLTGLAKRSDVHEVTVGLAIAPSGAADVGLFRGTLFSGPSRVGRMPPPTGRGMASGPVLVGNRITGTSATPAEQLAFLAVDQVKSREVRLITSP